MVKVFLEKLHHRDTKTQRVFDGSIFYGAIALIALTAVPYGTVDPWWESIFESIVFGLAILWLVEGALWGRWLKREHWLLLPLIGLVLFSFAQSIPLSQYDGGRVLGSTVSWTISADPFETRRFAYKLLAITLILGLLIRYVTNERQMRTLMYLIVGIAVASALFGLVRGIMPEQLTTLFGERLSAKASYAQFENRNHFAFLIEMAIGLLLGLAVGDRRHKKRLIFYLLSGVTLWVALLLTHSRGGALSLVVEVPFFVLLFVTIRNWSRPSISPKRLLRPRLVATVALVTVLLVGVGATVVVVGGEETIARWKLTAEEFESRSWGPPKVLRPQIWEATSKLIFDNAIAGVGFAGYSMAIPQYLNASGEWMLEQAHNDYLELLASGGMIGAALSLWFLVSFVRIARKRLRESSPFFLAVRCGALAGLSAVAVHSFFDYGLHITINALVCLVLVVIAVTLPQNAGSSQYHLR